MASSSFRNSKLTKAPPVEKGTVYDYVFDMSRGYSWVEWQKTVPEYQVPKGAKFGDIFVTTVDTIQASYITDVLVTLGLMLGLRVAEEEGWI